MELDAVFSNAMKLPLLANHLDNLYTPQFQKADVLLLRNQLPPTIINSITEDIKQLKEHIKLARQQRQCLKVGRDGLGVKMAEVHAVAFKMCNQFQIPTTDKRIMTLFERHQYLQELKDKIIPIKLREATAVISLLKETVQSLEAYTKHPEPIVPPLTDPLLQGLRTNSFARQSHSQRHPMDMLLPKALNHLAASSDDKLRHEKGLEDGTKSGDRGHLNRTSLDFLDELIASMDANPSKERGKEDDASSDSGTVRGVRIGGTNRISSPPASYSPNISSECPGRSPLLGLYPQFQPKLYSPLHFYHPLNTLYPSPVLASIPASTSDIPTEDSATKKGKGKIYSVLLGPAPWKASGYQSVVDVLKCHRTNDDESCPVQQGIREDPDDASFTLVDFRSRNEAKTFVNSWSHYRNHDLYHSINAVTVNVD